MQLTVVAIRSTMSSLHGSWLREIVSHSQLFLHMHIAMLTVFIMQQRATRVVHPSTYRFTSMQAWRWH